MTLGDALQRVERSRHQHHQRDPGALGRGPEPVRGAVGKPRPLLIGMEGESHAQHARLLSPVRDERPALRPLDREAAHHGEAPGMQACRLEREVVAITLPRGRDDHHPADAGAVHLGEQHLAGHQIRLLRALRTARRPRPRRRVRAPDVHLRIDDEHVAILCVARLGRRDPSPATSCGSYCCVAV
jgi:hypothetical protein